MSDHVLQKGPTFKHPTETEIDAVSRQVKVRYTAVGKGKVLTERLALPPDIADGILFTLLKIVQRRAPPERRFLYGSRAKTATRAPWEP